MSMMKLVVLDWAGKRGREGGKECQRLQRASQYCSSVLVDLTTHMCGLHGGTSALKTLEWCLGNFGEERSAEVVGTIYSSQKSKERLDVGMVKTRLHEGVTQRSERE